MKKLISRLLLCVIPLIFLFSFSIQPVLADGELDAEYNKGKGASNSVDDSALLSDGRVVIVGFFLSVSDVARRYIAVLNTDGSLDTSFDPGEGADQRIENVAVQSDGKIIITGGFSSYDGVPRAGIARLNQDGSLDTSFDPGTGPRTSFSSITSTKFSIQSDDKIVISSFNLASYNGTARTGVARLNTDGTLDTGYNPTLNTNSVTSINIQADDKVIIGGSFTTVNGTARNRIARLNTDGTLDTGFTPGNGPNIGPSLIDFQSDGKVIIAGSFTTVSTSSRRYIARLNTNGTHDTTFNPGTSMDVTPDALDIQADNSIIIGGNISSYNGNSVNKLFRIDQNGGFDATFSAGSGPLGTIRTITIRPNEEILVGGFFSIFNDVGRNGITELASNGAVTNDFDTGTGIYYYIETYDSAIQSDGKVIIAGSFNGPYQDIVRINLNGTLDDTFDPGTGVGPFETINALAIQSDGKIVIVGSFSEFNGTSRNNIARLNTDGSVDLGFSVGTGPNNSLTSVALQSDGKIIIGGYFNLFNGITSPGIVRLNTDGSVDTSLVTGTGVSGVEKVAIQTDGKILIAGEFFNYNGTPRTRVARLNTDGSLDSGFSVGTGPNSFLTALALQTDGKVIISGYFGNYDGSGIAGIVRLNSDGSRDTSFTPGDGLDSAALDIKIQTDGKIVIGGDFSTVDNISRSYFARLNPDGTLDTSFDAESEDLDSDVKTVSIQDDNDIIIGGEFFLINSAVRPGLARFSASVAAPAIILIELSLTTANSTSEVTADNFATLLIDGVVSSSETIDLDITGGTATGSGTDYTSPDPISVTIPTGTYDGTTNTAVIITPPSLINDTDVETNETILFNLTNPSSGLTIGDANGDSTTQTSFTYTITDDDGAAPATTTPVIEEEEEEAGGSNNSGGTRITVKPPQNLSASITDSSIVITWQETDPRADSYGIERKATSDTFFTKLATVDSGRSSYTDSEGITRNQTYVYRIAAYRGNLRSNSYSKELTVAFSNTAVNPVVISERPTIVPIYTVPQKPPSVVKPQPTTTPSTEAEPTVPMTTNQISTDTSQSTQTSTSTDSFVSGSTTPTEPTLSISPTDTSVENEDNSTREPASSGTNNFWWLWLLLLIIVSTTVYRYVQKDRNN